jgi:hypothetical protein
MQPPEYLDLKVQKPFLCQQKINNTERAQECLQEAEVKKTENVSRQSAMHFM